MSAKGRAGRDRNELREEALRPSEYLGHDRDRLGMHLIERGAYRIAESQLRRAIWLNPFAAEFKAHLAWCLHRQNRDSEARRWMAEAVRQDPDRPDVRRIQDLLDGTGTPVGADRRAAPAGEGGEAEPARRNV